MSRGQQATDASSFGRSAGGAMVRGVVLIVVAVLIGVALLNATDEPFTTADDRADEGGTAAVGDDDDEEATIGDSLPEGGTSTTTTEVTPTSAPAAARPAAEVTVLVANGSGVGGVAATFTERLGTAGYLTSQPTNVAGGGTVVASAVYFTEGFEAEAEALAATLSPAPAVAELPEPVPVTDLREAQVLLVVGPDLATG